MSQLGSKTTASQPHLTGALLPTFFLVNSTPGWMMRAAVTYLLATGLLPRAPTIPLPTPLQMAQRDDRHGSTDHPRAQRAVERLGGWIHETLMELWPTPSAYYSTETAVPRWMLPHQAPATRARTDCVTASPRVKTSVKCRSSQGHTAPS